MRFLVLLLCVTLVATYQDESGEEDDNDHLEEIEEEEQADEIEEAHYEQPDEIEEVNYDEHYKPYKPTVLSEASRKQNDWRIPPQVLHFLHRFFPPHVVSYLEHYGQFPPWGPGPYSQGPPPPRRQSPSGPPPPGRQHPSGPPSPGRRYETRPPPPGRRLSAESIPSSEAYLKAMNKEEKENKHSRKRRGAESELVDVYKVRHQSEFWHDLDGGLDFEVSDNLYANKPGYNAYKGIIKALAHHSPAKHIGTIDRGIIDYPELHIGDRVFGKKSDFDMATDADAFKFAPVGQRFFDQEEFYKYVKSGHLPVGKAFIIYPRAFTKYSKCKQSQSKTVFKPDWMYDPFSTNNKGWNEIDCLDIDKDTFQFIGLKKSKNGKKNHYVYFFRSRGVSYSFTNLNLMFVQEANPRRLKSALRMLNHNDKDGNLVATKIRAIQPNMMHSLGHEMTSSYGKIGNLYPYNDFVGTPYDQSALWRRNTFDYHPMFNGKDWQGSRYGNVIGEPLNPLFHL